MISPMRIFFLIFFGKEKFKMSDIDKYVGTNCLKTHLSLFSLNVGFMTLTQKQMTQIFPRTHNRVVRQLFVQIDKSTLKSWDDITNAFVKQYKYNTLIEVTKSNFKTSFQKQSFIELQNKSFGNFLECHQFIFLYFQIFLKNTFLYIYYFIFNHFFKNTKKIENQ